MLKKWNINGEFRFFAGGTVVLTDVSPRVWNVVTGPEVGIDIAINSAAVSRSERWDRRLCGIS